MLTENQILENKAKWLGLCSKLGFDMTKLCQYLDAVDYWHAPYSSQYNYSYSGGLCQYTLNLANELGTLSAAYYSNKYSKETIIKVALFKDIYRAELYEKYFKNVKNENNEWVQEEAYKYREKRATYGDLNFSSYMTIRHFYDKFDDEEIEAITQADTKNDYMGDIHNIMKSNPLVALTRMATIVVLYIDSAETK